MSAFIEEILTNPVNLVAAVISVVVVVAGLVYLLTSPKMVLLVGQEPAPQLGAHLADEPGCHGAGLDDHPDLDGGLLSRRGDHGKGGGFQADRHRALAASKPDAADACPLSRSG